MNDKSYVTLEQHVCPVCGKTEDTGSLLMDMRLKPTFNKFTTTGWGLCAEHKKLADDGYVALVECSNDQPTLESAVRTGNIAHVRRSAFDRLFNVPAPEGALCFMQVGVLEKLEKLKAPT